MTTDGGGGLWCSRRAATPSGSCPCSGRAAVPYNGLEHVQPALQCLSELRSVFPAGAPEVSISAGARGGRCRYRDRSDHVVMSAVEATVGPFPFPTSSVARPLTLPRRSRARRARAARHGILTRRAPRVVLSEYVATLDRALAWSRRAASLGVAARGVRSGRNRSIRERSASRHDRGLPRALARFARPFASKTVVRSRRSVRARPCSRRCSRLVSGTSTSALSRIGRWGDGFNPIVTATSRRPRLLARWPRRCFAKA